MASFVRLFLAAAVAPLRRWDAENALEGDTAAPGQCAAKAVAMRALTAEIAQARGKVWAQLMWDIEMQMRQTLESLRRLEAPTRVTAMALMVHKGPRWLRSGESFASPVLGTAWRFQAATGQLENPAQMRKARRDAARVLTILNEKAADAAKDAE